MLEVVICLIPPSPLRALAERPCGMLGGDFASPSASIASCCMSFGSSPDPELLLGQNWKVEWGRLGGVDADR